VVVEILDVQGFVEVEGFAETFHDLRSEAGVERSTWLGLPGARYTMRKRRMETKKRVTTFWMMLLPMKESIRNGLKC